MQDTLVSARQRPAPDELDTMIEVQDLRRNFGSKEAVAGISFSARRGEIFGLLGPNGAGKTTTIRLLTGQLDPSGGRARVAGYDVVKQRSALKARIGVVFEEQNLYERLSARQNLIFSCWLYGVPEKRADEILDLVRLRDRAKDSVSKFSNGMRQRLMIARALLHRPRVLFLDEPSRGLDPISARDVRRTIQELCQAGTTILLTTHLMEEADQLCHRVAFIVDGRLVANDEPRALKLAHGRRLLTVTLAGQSGDASGAPLEDVTLGMDGPADQARLAEWMAAGRVRAIHSRE
ncbi:MAG TPA: ABC transporter ATP-binding protein, partial [Ktedonobacterales bacterium]|nr:ABC transporter ATP-binding protein [Ktedonobacterales bacterium]